MIDELGLPGGQRPAIIRACDWEELFLPEQPAFEATPAAWPEADCQIGPVLEVRQRVSTSDIEPGTRTGLLQLAKERRQDLLSDRIGGRNDEAIARPPRHCVERI